MVGSVVAGVNEISPTGSPIDQGGPSGTSAAEVELPVISLAEVNEELATQKVGGRPTAIRALFPRLASLFQNQSPQTIQIFYLHCENAGVLEDCQQQISNTISNLKVVLLDATIDSKTKIQALLQYADLALFSVRFSRRGQVFVYDINVHRQFFIDTRKRFWNDPLKFAPLDVLMLAAGAVKNPLLRKLFLRRSDLAKQLPSEIKKPFLLALQRAEEGGFFAHPHINLSLTNPEIGDKIYNDFIALGEEDSEATLDLQSLKDNLDYVICKLRHESSRESKKISLSISQIIALIKADSDYPCYLKTFLKANEIKALLLAQPQYFPATLQALRHHQTPEANEVIKILMERFHFRKNRDLPSRYVAHIKKQQEENSVEIKHSSSELEASAGPRLVIDEENLDERFIHSVRSVPHLSVEDLATLIKATGECKAPLYLELLLKHYNLRKMVKAKPGALADVLASLRMHDSPLAQKTFNDLVKAPFFGTSNNLCVQYLSVSGQNETPLNVYNNFMDTGGQSDAALLTHLDFIMAKIRIEKPKLSAYHLMRLIMADIHTDKPYYLKFLLSRYDVKEAFKDHSALGYLPVLFTALTSHPHPDTEKLLRDLAKHTWRKKNDLAFLYTQATGLSLGPREDDGRIREARKLFEGQLALLRGMAASLEQQQPAPVDTTNSQAEVFIARELQKYDAFLAKVEQFLLLTQDYLDNIVNRNDPYLIICQKLQNLSDVSHSKESKSSEKLRLIVEAQEFLRIQQKTIDHLLWEIGSQDETQVSVPGEPPAPEIVVVPSSLEADVAAGEPPAHSLSLETFLQEICVLFEANARTINDQDKRLSKVVLMQRKSNRRFLGNEDIITGLLDTILKAILAHSFEDQNLRADLLAILHNYQLNSMLPPRLRSTVEQILSLPLSQDLPLQFLPVSPTGPEVIDGRGQAVAALDEIIRSGRHSMYSRGGENTGALPAPQNAPTIIGTVVQPKIATSDCSYPHE